MHNLICMLHMFRPYVIHQHIMEVTKETASRRIHQLWTAHSKDSQLLRNCPQATSLVCHPTNQTDFPCCQPSCATQDTLDSPLCKSRVVRSMKSLFARTRYTRCRNLHRPRMLPLHLRAATA
jgi:hypothetical protein